MKVTKYILGIGALAILGTAAVARTTSADFDLPGLNQQVQNHEARITNNEKDIKALQDATNTPPAANPAPVPEVTAQPTAAPAPAAPAETQPTLAPGVTPAPVDPTTTSHVGPPIDLTQ